MSIKPLPEDVIAQIKSSTTITSLNGVVCGLFKNSLDAGATKITVKIDYARGNCSVEDNGAGILPTEFASDGGLGKLHYTSRFPAHPSHHGSSGTFLASVAALSLMSIASHHQDYRSHNSVKIHNSKVIARHTPSPPDQRLLSFSHGTRVTVRDLFGSMPVRVKQRALTLDRATMLRDWENLKLSIVPILLAWPGQASISIRDGTGQQTAILRNSEAINAEVAERARRSLLLSRVSGLLCQAHLFDDADPATWVSLKASAAQLSIHAAVCLIPVATKRLQFISIGIQPLPNTGGQNVLYEDINRMFANSSFGAEEELGGVTEDEKVRRVTDRGNKPEYTNRELKSKRGIDRHPMFYIHVELDDAASYKAGHDADEMLDGRRNHLNAIIDVLKAMIHAFLKKHQFHPSSYKPIRRRSPKRHGSLALESGSSSRDNSPGLQVRTVPWTVGLPNTQAPSDAESCDSKETSGNESRFGEGSRMISGLRPPALSKALSHEKLTVRRLHSQSIIEDAATSPTSPALFDAGGGLLRAPFLEPEKTLDSDCFGSDDPVSATRKAKSDEISVHEEAIPWVNPTTKQKCFVDTRTGFVNTRAEADEVRESERQPNRLTKRLRGLRSGLRSPSSGAPGEPSPWMEDLLSSWKNPVFEAPEPPIPVAFDASMLGDSASGYFENGNSCHHGLAEILPKIESRISREAIRTAEVISQVDRKFILVKVSLKTGLQAAHTEDGASLLVIIDQHAADERCRVEDLMAGYFDAAGGRANSEVLNTSLQYEISSHERPLFEQHLSYFDYWGIGYSLNSLLSGPQFGGRKLPSFLKISSLPPCIAERCSTEPRLLIDLLRKEAWKLDETGRNHGHLPRPDAATPVGEQGSERQHWLSRLHGCPRGILDMINSRACRSAIMFNDPLSLGDCKALLARLAECAFPFQCAHGRPSMVPLVDMGNQGVDEVDTGSFGKQFRTWQARTKERRS